MAIDRQPIVVAPETSVIEAIRLMNRAIAALDELPNLPVSTLDLSFLSEARASCVLVVDGQAQLVGIFRARDAMRLVAMGEDLQQLTMGKVVQPPKIVVQRSQISDLATAQSLIEQHNCHHLPIFNDVFNDVSNDVDKDHAPQQGWSLISQASIIWANRQMTANQLSNMESQKKAILTAIPDLIYRISDKGIYLESFASNYVTDLLPANIDSINKHLSEVLPPELADRKMQAIQRAIATDKIQSFEQQWALADGTQYEEVQVVKLNDHEALTIIRNISDRKQAELALSESETRFRNIFDYAAVAIATAQLNGRYITANATMCEILGYSDTEFQNLSFQEITHPDDLNQDLLHYQQLLEGNIERYHLEKRFRHKNGEFIWGLMSVSLVKDTANQPLYTIALIQNINELKAVQQKLSEVNQELELKIQQRTADLAESELRKQQLLDAIPDLLLRLKRDGTCLDCIIPKTAHLEEFVPIKENVAEVLGSQVWIEQLAAFDRAIATGEVQIYEHQLEKHGKLVYEEVRVSPCGDDEVLVLVRNISDRKQAEADLQMTNNQLIATNYELERLTRLKDEFLATMSHELRTPLNAIMGISEGLMDEVFGELNPKQHSSLTTINKSGEHLLELINDILDVAKLESGMFNLDLSAVSLTSLCNSTISFVRYLAATKNIKLTSQIHAHTPEMLVVDERRMRQILINLLSNAIKFTPAQGKVNLEVKLVQTATPAIAKTITTTAPNEQQITQEIWFTVTDTGIGIAEADLEKLFQPFVQIDSSLNRQYTGTGLGLHLVKKLTELHGGQVAVVSQLDQGSSFVVKIPFCKP